MYKLKVWSAYLRVRRKSIKADRSHITYLRFHFPVSSMIVRTRTQRYTPLPSTPKCLHCGIRGHIAAICPRTAYDGNAPFLSCDHCVKNIRSGWSDEPEIRQVVVFIKPCDDHASPFIRPTRPAPPPLCATGPTRQLPPPPGPPILPPLSSTPTDTSSRWRTRGCRRRTLCCRKGYQRRTLIECGVLRSLPRLTESPFYSSICNGQPEEPHAGELVSSCQRYM